jgi:hypothetical protein
MAIVATPSFAGIAGVTTDCNWDCSGLDAHHWAASPGRGKDPCLVRPRWAVAGCGKLYLFVPENTHLPHFVVLNGDLKTAVGAQALSLTGPPEQPEIIDGELFLVFVFNETDQSNCRRRVEPEG